MLMGIMEARQLHVKKLLAIHDAKMRDMVRANGSWVQVWWAHLVFHMRHGLYASGMAVLMPTNALANMHMQQICNRFAA